MGLRSFDWDIFCEIVPTLDKVPAMLAAAGWV